MIRWRIERWRPERVQPLEVWDLPYRGRLLYERLGAPFVEEACRGGRSDDEIDGELSAAFAHLASSVAADREVFVTGGLCERRGFRSRLLAMPRVTIDDAPLHPGEAGARAALERRGVQSSLLVDLGQTALKLCRIGTPVRREQLERPPELTRHFTERAPPSPEVAAQQAARLAAWLSGAIARSLGDAGALVLGLPCALDDRGTPGPCTYAGWAGDGTWIPRMLARVDAALPVPRDDEVAVLLLNDAELAASSAMARGFVGLVVTLGFGPGAAWAGVAP